MIRAIVWLIVSWLPVAVVFHLFLNRFGSDAAWWGILMLCVGGLSMFALTVGLCRYRPTNNSEDKV